MTSWYNALFNAQEELNKKRKDLKLNYTEDYSEILPLSEDYFSQNETEEVGSQPMNFGEPTRLYNNDNNTNSTAPKPEGYGSVESKSLKVIEKHSMNIKGVERNPMIARAYLLIGKSKFYQGKYFEALDALNFVTTNFPKSKDYNEALFFTTLADIKGGNYFDGQEKLIKLYEKEKINKELRYLVASNYADFLIKNEKYSDAIEPIEKAVQFSRNSDEKARTLFTLGQVYSKLGMQQEAGETFTQVYKLKPGFNMEVKSQLAIAENFNPKINNYTTYKTHLLNQSKKGIYVSKKNEFYYAIAEMAYKDGNLDEAIKYSQLALKEPISDAYVRGKTYENYANIEFSKRNYLHATSYYDSAITSFTKENDKNKIAKKNDVLKRLMQMHYVVEKNDSILKLAKMPKDEQEAFFTTYIEKLKKDEEKQLEKEQKEVTDFQLGGKVQSFTSSFDEKNSNKFYFYNQSLKSNGKAEFQRIWNSPSLKDNWRNSSQAGATIEDKEAELKGLLAAGDPRRFEINYYMEKIPRTIKDLNDLKIVRDTTQLALGTGYYDYFYDTKLAVTTLEKLIASPPKSKDVEVQALYQLYRIYKDRDKTFEDKYKNIILTQHGNTIYAGYILNPNVDFISPETKEALLDYEATYDLYKDEKYDEAKARVNQAISKYPTEIIIAKFALLNAFAVSKTETAENFEKALEIIVIAYEGTDEAKRAQLLLNKLRNIEPSKVEEIKEQTPERKEIKKESKTIKSDENSILAGEDPLPTKQ